MFKVSKKKGSKGSPKLTKKKKAVSRKAVNRYPVSGGGE